MSSEPRIKMDKDSGRFQELSAAYFFAALSLAILLTLLLWASTYGYLIYIDQVDLLPYFPGLWLYLTLIGAMILSWIMSRRAFARARKMSDEEARPKPPPSN
ncbi:MAG: hypothetical protein CSA62_05655 [Planctomycetota bacterium]|nr:MAG: hypothetical protein CSA62_05655 [Planctomycetota bacterium]